MSKRGLHAVGVYRLPIGIERLGPGCYEVTVAGCSCQYGSYKEAKQAALLMAKLALSLRGHRPKWALVRHEGFDV